MDEHGQTFETEATDATLTSSLVLRLDTVRCAIPTSSVVEMLQSPEATPMPGTSRALRGALRGAISLRGRTLPLADMRVHFGMSSSRQAQLHLADELVKREREHRTWLAELASVREDRAFEVTTDP